MVYYSIFFQILQAKALTHNTIHSYSTYIKPYATARRAWLFADTPKGAYANAVLYTLVESARANKREVYEYLKYLLMEMPNNAHLEPPEVVNQYLPWTKELPEECRLEHKHKKCFKNRCSRCNSFSVRLHYAMF